MAKPQTRTQMPIGGQLCFQVHWYDGPTRSYHTAPEMPASLQRPRTAAFFVGTELGVSLRPRRKTVRAALAESTTSGTSASENLPVSSLINPIRYVVPKPARLLIAFI